MIEMEFELLVPKPKDASLVNKELSDTEDDLALISAAKKDPEGFAVLYDKYVTPIYRYFLARTSHVPTAEDLTSQVFLKAFNAFARYEPKTNSFGSWLFTIAHNTLVDNYKKPYSFPLDLAEELPDGSNIENDTDKRRELEALKEMVESLPDRDREIVLLRSSEDLSFSQISQVLKVSEGAARTAYHRAVQKLAKVHQDRSNTHATT